MILFCLPYAGGSEAIYYKWKQFIGKPIKLFPIELKGRGKRYNQNFYTDINEAVNDIYDSIKEDIEENEYAIYGHSMGSLLAYELYYKISSMGKPKPKHIFFSGYSAPGSIKEREITYTLPDYEFMNKIIELGGTPQELLDNKELLDLFIPILKNDIKLLENYTYKDRAEKINCDISILNGSKDSIKINEITEWRKHTSAKCTMYTFDGNHFFINNNIENITNVIRHTLLEGYDVL